MAVFRTLGALGLALVAVTAAGAAPAQEAASAPPWRHATALIGEPKYGPDFKRFDYVNPDAPKGGLLRLSGEGTFDSLNIVPPRGNIATGVGTIYDTLMASSRDESSTEYGLLAEALRYPDDYSSVTYRLRANARWHDGQPVTADDVVFSFNAIKEFNPRQSFYYRHVTKAEVTGEREVTFTFDEKGNRELPHIVGQLVVFPKHFWEGTDANGNKRDISKSGLEIPLGSGPYRIKSVTPGRSLSLERVPDYWGKDLPVNVGTNNFDEIRYDYYRDDTVELEAFKADQFDYRVEASALNWATRYDFPAVKDGRVVKELFENDYRNSGVGAGFIFNLARPVFQDIRVRQAFSLVMPFEEMNKLLFFGQYSRIDSFFYGSSLASSGLPEGREKEILESVKDKIPPEIFTTPYKNAVNDTPQQQRDNQREALRLLNEAGWQLKGNALVNAKTGQPLKLELLLNGPTYEKVAPVYQTALRKIGIDMSVRFVDPSQYQNRVRSRDFDMIYGGWPESMSPGNEQLDFFGSDSAKQPGTMNYSGVADPGIDAVIRVLLSSKDRDDLVAATKALDRVLLWKRILVPGWTLRAARTARWDRFSYPTPLPEFSDGFPDLWWYDQAKAAKTGAAR